MLWTIGLPSHVARAHLLQDAPLLNQPGRQVLLAT
jgi:hypothetical protein